MRRLDQALFQEVLYECTTRRGNLDYVTELVHAGANVNMKLSGDISLLHQAVLLNRLCLVNFFLKNRLRKTIDADICDAAGMTPLHYAAMQGNETAAKLLIEAGADLDKKDNIEGKTPLHYAAEKGYIDVVKLLVQNFASRDVEDSKGNTPAMSAFISGRYEIHEFLEPTVKQDTKPNGPPLIHLADHYRYFSNKSNQNNPPEIENYNP